MKNIALLLLTILALGCKECPECEDCTDRSAQSKEQKPAACVRIENYPETQPVAERALWLFKNRENFCDYQAVLAASYGAHKIEEDRVIRRPSAISVTRTWAEISHYIGQYSLYGGYLKIKTDAGGRTIVETAMIKTFEPDSYCYSVALFRAIESVYRTPEAVKFTVESVRSDDGSVQEAMIMEVVGGQAETATRFLDYSKEPKFMDYNIERPL